MAFQQPTIFRQAPQQSAPRSHESTSIRRPSQPTIEHSQEWVLFSPSQAESSTDKTRTSQTAGLSRTSDLGTLHTNSRSGQLESSILEEDVTEDGELDSLDDGLHAFREPPLYQTQSLQANGPLLPAHDGLGSFQASSPLVLEQLWRHEHHNSKRKHETTHRRSSSVQRRLNTVEEMEVQANEEKKVRIEKWRMEQSQALMEDVEKATRRQMRRDAAMGQSSMTENVLGTTPRQADYMPKPETESTENEPFWRRITRRFIRDVIGIDDPLLSVILGESLPGEVTPRPSSPVNLPTIQENMQGLPSDSSWRDRLLQRIARELGVTVNQLTPHPGAFSTYQSPSTTADYAGIPIRPQPTKRTIPSTSQAIPIVDTMASEYTPNFPPTFINSSHAESWGFEEEPTLASSATISNLDLRREREYWERELDVNNLLQFLTDRFSRASQQHPEQQSPSGNNIDDSASRAAIIRQHHPLVARADRLSAARRNSRSAFAARQRSRTSSCASESVKSGGQRGSALRSGSVLRSGSSRNYWDIGGDVGSGSLLASGGGMGWGEV